MQMTDRRLTPGALPEVMGGVNLVLQGWTNYYHQRNRTSVFRGITWYTEECVLPFAYDTRLNRGLRIKSFYGTSENAVKTQIWIAISVYVLVAIIKKRLNVELSLYTILQIFSITVFEKIFILQALTDDVYNNEITSNHIQLKLYDS